MAVIRRIMRSEGAQLALARVLGLYLDFAFRTTRWTLEGEEHVAPHFAGPPCIVAVWHERLPLLPFLWVVARRRGIRPGSRPHVLASRHRDGRFIGEVLRRFGVAPVHGSTADGKGRARGGVAGVRALVRVLEGGEPVVITPDGPRGPRRRAAPGVAQIAGLAGVPVVPAGAQVSARRVLGSWDRMVLPLPFGRGVIVCGPPIAVSRRDWASAVPAIEAALTAACERADALCGA